MLWVLFVVRWPTTNPTPAIKACGDDDGTSPKIVPAEMTPRGWYEVARIASCTAALSCHSVCLASETYKCVVDGKTTYAQQPCGQAAQRLDLPGDATRRRQETESRTALERSQAEREREASDHQAKVEQLSRLRTKQRELEAQLSKVQARAQRCETLRRQALQAQIDSQTFELPELRKAARSRQIAAEQMLLEECQTR